MAAKLSLFSTSTRTRSIARERRKLLSSAESRRGRTRPRLGRGYNDRNHARHNYGKKRTNRVNRSPDDTGEQADEERSWGNQLKLKPLGNLLFNPSQRVTRTRGLGGLARLPDELLLTLFSHGAFEARDLTRCRAVSKAFLGWVNLDSLWKLFYIKRTNGRLLNWTGTWRSSYVDYIQSLSIEPLNCAEKTTTIPTEITTPTHHSDILFQPHLAASFDPSTIFNLPSFKETVTRRSGIDLGPDDLPREPLILTGLMQAWPACNGGRLWTLTNLANRFPTTSFRAEATLTTLPAYQKYHNESYDDSPLYLFDSDFVEKTQQTATRIGQERPGLGEDYTVPTCFSQDLFSVMGIQRPDYRWIIAGPERSGSTWHQDPNGTSAWNAVTVGSKAWVMFPPHITPPGVFVSEDRAEVCAPHSLAEWFISYYAEAKARYGPNAKEKATRNIMQEGICRAGEIFFVPQGWWHIVINLEPSIAVTQNYVSRHELAQVLRFMRDRPEQVSGFKLDRPVTASLSSNGEDGVSRDMKPIDESGLDECDEILEGVYELFYEALAVKYGDDQDVRAILDDVAREDPEHATAMEGVCKEDGAGGIWEKMKSGDDDDDAVGFRFGFFAGSEDDDLS